MHRDIQENLEYAWEPDDKHIHHAQSNQKVIETLCSNHRVEKVNNAAEVRKFVFLDRCIYHSVNVDHVKVLKEDAHEAGNVHHQVDVAPKRTSSQVSELNTV